VDFKVPGSYLKSIEVGQKVKITVDGYDHEFSDGAIDAIDSKVDAQGHGLKIRATVPNQLGQLKPGLYAKVTVVIGENEKALIVPEKCLTRNGNEESVLIAEDGIAKEVPVVTGVRENGRVEILKGLKSKNKVIVAGFVRNGYPVTINKLPSDFAADLNNK
jgi:membrane fusion protein (multidrug efflux system)